MLPLSLSYIGGFFDGEGCISTHPSRNRRGLFGTDITVAQSGPEGLVLLNQIRGFLLPYDIKSYLGTRPRTKTTHKQMWMLRICARPSVMAFLKLFFPYLRIKRVVAQDTIRFYTIYPSIRGAVTANRNRRAAAHFNLTEALAQRAQGLSYAAIAAAQHVSESFVTQHLKRGYTDVTWQQRAPTKQQLANHDVEWPEPDY
jgi:hypothetical protein